MFGIEHELAGARRILPEADHGPAGDHLGEAGDVVLGVDRAHADRMQLENFAGEVLVEAAPPPLPGDRVRDRSNAHCRDRSASPDGFRPPAACRRSGRAHAAGSPRARTRRRSAAPRPCRRRRRNGSTRTRRAARQSRSRRRAPRRCAPWPRRGRAAAARPGRCSPAARLAARRGVPGVPAGSLICGSAGGFAMPFCCDCCAVRCRTCRAIRCFS